MPIGASRAFSPVLEFFEHEKPTTILDIGVGSGAWGMLFREYSDIMNRRYTKDKWLARIDGVEGFLPYMNSAYDFYNEVYFMKIQDFEPPITYDFVYAGDIIEHLTDDEGLELINKFDKSTLVITTPHLWYVTEDDYMGNELERHKTLWDAERFERLGFKILCREYPVIAYRKPE